MEELIQYYRYYRNCPMVVPGEEGESMKGYWGKKKALYYRKVKRQLNLEEESSKNSPTDKITP